MNESTITLFRVDAFQITYGFGLLRYQQYNKAIESLLLPLEIIRSAAEELKVQLSRIVQICEDLKIDKQTQTDDEAERVLIETAETVMNLRFQCDFVYNEMNLNPDIWVQTPDGPQLTEEHNSVCDLFDKADDAMRAKTRELSSAVFGAVWNHLRSKSGKRERFIWYLDSGMEAENVQYVSDRAMTMALIAK